MPAYLVIILAVVPSLIVAVTAFVLAKYFVENDQKKRLLELKFHSKELVTPIRLQAYERMAMFLERIDPNQLLFRVSNPELTAYQMQTILLATIRSEYEHNLSQQVYISPEAWEGIKNAKEKVVNLINLAAGHLDEGAMATDLAGGVLSAVADESPTAKAMERLKKDTALLY